MQPERTSRIKMNAQAKANAQARTLKRVVDRLYLDNPNFRRGWQLAQMAPDIEAPEFNLPPSYFTPAECEARAAMGRAFFLAGAAGANANINHPMRPAWEALRAYFDNNPA